MYRITALRAATAVALTAGFACLGTATATAETGNSSDVNTLAGSLAKGYGLNNCQSADLSGGDLADLRCGQNPDSNGPGSAVYQLYKNTTDLTTAFNSNLNGVTLAPCTSSGSAQPVPWHQGNSDQNAGQAACGNYQGVNLVIWTVDSKNVLGSIYTKGDGPSLYKWWQSNA